MLSIASEFPFPGSTALLEGLRFRVIRHHADGTALLTRDGAGSSFQRTEPIADLLDPAEADLNAALSLERSTEADARIALWIARHLASRNEVALGDLHRDAVNEARIGKLPEPRDNRHISALLRQLGWAKRGWTGFGYARSPLYVRTSTSVATGTANEQDLAA